MGHGHAFHPMLCVIDPDDYALDVNGTIDREAATLCVKDERNVSQIDSSKDARTLKRPEMKYEA